MGIFPDGHSSVHLKSCTVKGPVTLRGQLHLHGSPTDIGHGSINDNCQGSLAHCRVWGGGTLKSE